MTIHTILTEEIKNFRSSGAFGALDIYTTDGNNIDHSSKTEGQYIEICVRKANKLDINTPILGATYISSIEKGTIFTADRTIIKSLAFLIDGVSIGYLITSKKWKKRNRRCIQHIYKMERYNVHHFG